MSKLKYLYANGDSWMVGDGVENEERWSKLLSDKLGLIEINESTSGGSNDRMVRRTIRWFDNNIDKWDEVLVILGFIEPIRIEYWNNNSWSGWNIASFGPAGAPGNILEMKDIIDDEEWWKKYITFFQNDVSLNYNLKNQILLLTSFFDSNNIKYLMFFSWGLEIEEFKDFKTINKKYFISERFKEYIENKIGRKKALTKCDHASVEGHKIWTEKLCKELKDRKVT
jgi:hypothetical protein